MLSLKSSDRDLISIYDKIEIIKGKYKGKIGVIISLKKNNFIVKLIDEDRTISVDFKDVILLKGIDKLKVEHSKIYFQLMHVLVHGGILEKLKKESKILRVSLESILR